MCISLTLLQVHQHLLLPLPLPLVCLRNLPSRLGCLLGLRLLCRHLVEEHLATPKGTTARKHLRLLKLPSLVACELLASLRRELVAHTQLFALGQPQPPGSTTCFEARKPALHVVAEQLIGFCKRPASSKAGACDARGSCCQGDKSKRCWHGSPQR